jgi:prepilin peptidase CpaA
VPGLFAGSAVVATLALIAIVDVRTRRIPNMIVAPLALAALAHAAWVGGATAALAALVGLAVGVALLYFQFSRGWMGAGDVKLLGALGCWSGWLGAVYILLLGSAIGGVLALMALTRLARPERSDVGRKVMHFAVSGGLVVPEPSQLSRARGVPFGVALALAGALVLGLGLGR